MRDFDPWLSTFIAWPEGDFVRLLFHELAHQVVYASGDTLFNGVTWENAAQTYDEMPGLATFGNFMLLPRGAEGTVYFQYELPADVVVSEDGDTVYRLTIHKQPGTRHEPLYLTVSLPSGTELLEASPTPTQVDGDIFIFELSLASDMELTMRYR